MPVTTQSPAPPPRTRTTNQSGDEVNQLPFFHGAFSCQDEIADLMLPYLHTDGCFLLRHSSGSGPGTYTLSITHQGGIKHIRIYSTLNTYYLEDRVHFTTLQKLVDAYGITDIPNIEGVHGVRLRYPILKPRPGPNFSELPIAVTARRPQEPTSISMPDIRAGPSSTSHRQINSGFNSLSSNNHVSSDFQQRPKSKSESDCSERIPLPISPKKKKKTFFRSHSDNTDARQTTSPPMMKKVAVKKPKFKGSKGQVSPLTLADQGKSASAPDFHKYRPPLPIPRAADEQPEPSTSKWPYSTVRDLDADRTSDLIERLALEEKQNKVMCSCGLPLKQSQLQGGWRVHRLKEGSEKGKVFFQKGSDTRWTLPPEIESALTSSQKKFIDKVSKNPHAFSQPAEANGKTPAVRSLSDTSAVRRTHQPNQTISAAMASCSSVAIAAASASPPGSELLAHPMFKQRQTELEPVPENSPMGASQPSTSSPYQPSTSSVQPGSLVTRASIQEAPGSSSHQPLTDMPSHLPSHSQRNFISRDNSYIINSESSNG